MEAAAGLPPPGLAVPGLGRPPGVLPDMSKPPPGFMQPAAPPQGLPPPAQMGVVPHFDESSLIPSLVSSSIHSSLHNQFVMAMLNASVKMFFLSFSHSLTSTCPPA